MVATTGSPSSGSQDVRRALLIGVGEYEHPIEPIPVAVNDVARMQQALANSGYDQITTLVTGPGSKSPTRNAIRHAIQTTLEEAARESTLLLYFTGHGANVDGRDYLCPSDTAPILRAGSEQDLVPIDLGLLAGESLTKSSASTIVFIVDACRDIATTGGKAFLRAAPLLGEETRQRVYTVQACRTGEVARYDETLGGSLLTLALAEAFQPDTEPRTIADIMEYARTRMEELSSEYKLPVQVPTLRGDADSPDYANRVICSGSHDDEAWTALTAVLSEFVGPDCPELEDPQFIQFLRQLRQAAAEKGPDDAWLDTMLPFRWVSSLSLLQPTSELNQRERLVVASAALLAESLSRVALRLSPESQNEVEAAVARQILIYEERCRRAAHDLDRRSSYLEDRGLQSDAAVIRQWLKHQAVRRSAGIWTLPGFTEQAEVLAAVLEHRESRREGLGQALVHLCASLLLGLRDPALPKSVTTLRDADQRSVELELHRCFAVGHLAYLMAADLRVAGQSLVQEVGLRSDLDLWESKRQLRDVSWEIHDDLRVLMPDLVCSHAATDRAARDLVGRIREFVVENEGNIPHYAVSESRIVPAKLGGHPTYRPPVPQITLDTQAVRQLLVGRDLYGSPLVVVRELYQNALDACRYRTMRERYLSLRNPKRLGQYVGRIQLSVHRTEEGHLVLDALDNGVGMGDEEVDGPFTSAGRRFTDLPSFQQEQDRWQELDAELLLHPNSRFGIGVFSYFLLAEELEVFSTRQDPGGGLRSPGVHLHLSSASGLVTKRILAGGAPTTADGGTLVRLFLNERAWQALDASLEQIVEDTLGYSEFELSVADDHTSRTWGAGAFVGEAPAAVHAFTAENTQAWWIRGDADLLADGVRQRKRTVGYMVNLGGAHRPKLSVSRNEVESWEREWVEETLAGAPAALKDWDHLYLDWLWSLTAASPRLAEAVHRRAQQDGWAGDLLVSSAPGSPKANVTRLGVVPADSRLAPHLNESRRRRGYPHVEFGVGEVERRSVRPPLPDLDPATSAWRLACWWDSLLGVGAAQQELNIDTATTAPYPRRPLAEVMSLDTVPAPTPIEGAVLSHLGRYASNTSASLVEVSLLSFADVVQIAHLLKLNLASVLSIVIKYRAVGIVVMTATKTWSPGQYDFVPNAAQAAVCTIRESDATWWPTPVASTRAPYRWLCHALSNAQRVSFDDLVAAARELQLQELERWLDAVPRPPEDLLRALRADRRPRLPAAQVRVHAALPEERRALRVEEWLDGMKLDDDAETRALRAAAREQDQLSLGGQRDKAVWSRDVDGVGPWLEGRITPRALLVRAIRLGVRLDEVVEILTRWPSVQLPLVHEEVLTADVPQSLRSLIEAVPPALADEDGLHWPGNSAVVLGLLYLLSDNEREAREAEHLLLNSAWGEFLEWPPGLELPGGQVPERVHRLVTAAVVKEGGPWPLRLGVLETIEWWARSRLSLSEGIQLLEECKDVGLESALDMSLAEGDPTEEDWKVTVFLARLLHRSWPLSFAVAGACELSRKPAEDVLRVNLWWLQQVDLSATALAEHVGRSPRSGRYGENVDELATFGAGHNGSAQESYAMAVAYATCKNTTLAAVAEGARRLKLDLAGTPDRWPDRVPDWRDAALAQLAAQGMVTGGVLYAADMLSLTPEEVLSRLAFLGLVGALGSAS